MALFRLKPTYCSPDKQMSAPGGGAGLDESRHGRIERVLFHAALGVSRAKSPQLFDDLVRSAAETLSVDFAFIALVDDPEWRHAHTIAFYDAGRNGENFHYRLAGTPCANVLGKEFRFFASGVQDLFPDPHAKALHIAGYAGMPLFDSNGKALGLIATMSRQPLSDEGLFESILRIFAERVAAELERADIDRVRREREQALRKSEERLRATVTSALDCIIGMDSEGNIIEFNPAAERCFGYTRDEVLGRSLADTIIPPSQRDGHKQGMHRYLTSGVGNYMGRRVEVTALRRDGTVFPAELTIGVARDPSGHMFIGYLRDISQTKQAEAERGQLEAQLRQAQKMEAIGHLTGGIAHDFNNILTGIMGYIDMASERPVAHGDEKLQRYLERAQRAGLRARDLIQQMLTFSRGQRGTRRAIDIAAVLGETAKLLGSSLPATVELTLELADDLPTISMDPVHLEQIIVNLCLNARDAMKGVGSLRLSAHIVECHTDCLCASCQASLRGPYLTVSVQDSGAGIRSDVLERIFEPFFSTKDVGKGSGMGLAMVHGIVHDYGGHITVTTAAQQGATFNILLPLTLVDEKTQVAATADHVSAPYQQRLAGHVLLIDDDEDARDFMVDLLESWGLDVVPYNNGKHALAETAASNRAFDLAVVDYTMPGLTGVQVAAGLRQRYSDLPVILYTGFSDDISEDDIRDLGIKALVRKPIDKSQFFELVKANLRKGR